MEKNITCAPERNLTRLLNHRAVRTLLRVGIATAVVLSAITACADNFPGRGVNATEGNTSSPESSKRLAALIGIPLNATRENIAAAAIEKSLDPNWIQNRGKIWDTGIVVSPASGNGNSWAVTLGPDGEPAFFNQRQPVRLNYPLLYPDKFESNRTTVTLRDKTLTVYAPSAVTEKMQAGKTTLAKFLEAYTADVSTPVDIMVVYWKIPPNTTLRTHTYSNGEQVPFKLIYQGSVAPEAMTSTFYTTNPASLPMGARLSSPANTFIIIYMPVIHEGSVNSNMSLTDTAAGIWVNEWVGLRTQTTLKNKVIMQEHVSTLMDAFAFGDKSFRDRVLGVNSHPALKLFEQGTIPWKPK